MTIESGTRGDKYEDTAFAVRLYGSDFREMWERLPDQVDCAADIDIHYKVEVVEIEGLAVTIDDLFLLAIVKSIDV